MIDVDGVDEEEAVKRIRKIDRERKRYRKYFTGKEWDDMTNYDLPINATKIDLDQLAQLVKCYIKIRGYDIEKQ